MRTFTVDGHDSPVVVLDEATTGLNPAAAAEVLRAIEKLCEGRTTLAVTHDVQVALTADRIAWIEDGKLLFTDAPARLLARNEAFRAWVAAAEGDREGVRVGVSS